MSGDFTLRLTDADRCTVASCPLFAELPDGDLDRALSIFNARVAEYGRGSFVHRAGERLGFFGLVLDGNVRVFTDDINGDSMMMASVTRGDTFGESLCWLRVSETDVYICAPDGARVLCLGLDAFRTVDLGQGDLIDELYRRFVSMLARRTLDMNERIQILSKKTLRERLTAFFTQCEHKYRSRSFLLPFDRASLAVYLGADRSALSRELSAMRRDGIIDFSHNYFRLL